MLSRRIRDVWEHCLDEVRIGSAHAGVLERERARKGSSSWSAYASLLAIQTVIKVRSRCWQSGKLGDP